MLNMLNVLGKTWGPPPLSSSSPQNIQHIQHIQHFCRKKHILIQHGPQNSTYSTFPLKEAHFLKKMLLSAEMLNMLNSLARGHLLISPKTFNIFNIFNISAERSTFWFNMGPRIQHIQHFPWKKTFFLRKCASFCWNVEYVEFSGQGSPSNFPQNIQHIQHIQHFCRKKHILIQHGAQNSTYSTFPLKEAFFWENVLLSGEMLNMLNFFGHVCVNGWCPMRIWLFNTQKILKGRVS